MAIAFALLAIFVAEGAVHLWVHPQPDPAEADRVSRTADSTWQSAAVAGSDGARLSAWIFTPRRSNGSAVILLHGVNDTRRGVLLHAQYLLQAGFTVLTPDSRGHGASGGSLLTYGVREGSDVHAWADWLFRNRPIERLYGLGESMGAAILLQSLPGEPRFRAVVAECPFSTFEQVAYYRLERISGLGRWASWPTVQAGFLYVHLRRRGHPRDAGSDFSDPRPARRQHSAAPIGDAARRQPPGYPPLAGARRHACVRGRGVSGGVRAECSGMVPVAPVIALRNGAPALEPHSAMWNRPEVSSSPLTRPGPHDTPIV
jgi:pimeloyl-ACP methyl ester carboxylesterase